jgi:glycosyltransferase involved in cell wall biosynthesis/SAM-dependent methyltransferase
MGVVERKPFDLEKLYNDGYYGSEEHIESIGYSDYAFTAEHGVSWAAALVQLVKNGGSILDIGCVDGHLLKKVGPEFNLFGVEMNRKMSDRATDAGIKIIGRDLLDPTILDQYIGRFDVVTAIAVFEHLPDILAGFKRALDLMNNNGVLLFEVPLLSDVHDNTVWFESSLEHIFYPSVKSIEYLVGRVLKRDLVGTELYIEGFGSNYIGLISADKTKVKSHRDLLARLMNPILPPKSKPERLARFQLLLTHGAKRTDDLIGTLAELPPSQINSAVLARLRDFWLDDRYKLSQAENERLAMHGEPKRLAAEIARQGLAAQQQREQAEKDRSQLRAEIQRIEAQMKGLVVELTRQRLLAQQGDAETDQVQLRADIERFAAETKRLNDELSVNQALARQQREDAEKDQVQLRADIKRFAAETKRLNDELSVNRALARQQREDAEKDQVQLRADIERFAAETKRLNHELSVNRALARQQQKQAEKDKTSLQALVVSLEQQINQAREQHELLKTALMCNEVKLLREVLQRASERQDLHFKLGQLEKGLAEVVPDRNEVRAETTGSEIAVIDPGSADPGPAALELPVIKLSAITCMPDIQDVKDPVVWPVNYPLISVVIPCFNYGRFIHEAIDSVLAQTFKNIEIIVVEGGSTDAKTRTVVAALERPHTRVVFQESPHQVGANRNRGIAEARGKYICCLDADDCLQPTYLEKAAFLLEEYEYDVVSTSLQFFGLRSDAWTVAEQPDLSQLVKENQVLTAAVFRKRLWWEAGGYRDVDRSTTGYVYEDWSFWIRVAALGARFRNISQEKLFLYRSHGPSLSQDPTGASMERQRLCVNAINSDVVTERAIEYSRQANRECRKATQPLVNLVRATPPSEKGPVLWLALPFMILGGAERLLSGVISHLRSEGWRIVITTSISTGAEHGDTTAWFEESTSEIYQLPRFLKESCWVDFVKYLVGSKHVDVLWIVGSKFVYDLLPRLKSEFPHIKVVDLLFNTVGHTTSNRLYGDYIDLNVVESSEVRSWLLKANVPHDRISVIPSGVDLGKYAPRAERDGAVSKLLNAEPKDMIIGFSGRWSEEKDPLVFVEIARRMDPNLPVRFVMTGTGHMRQQIEAEIASARFPPGRFTLVGQVADLTQWLGSFDVLVLPSRIDGRPVVVLEALAMGVAVVASHIGALPELIQDGCNGFLIEPGDIDRFVGRLTALALSHERLLRMKRAARRSAELNLDAKVMLSHYERALRDLLPDPSADGDSSPRGPRKGH